MKNFYFAEVDVPTNDEYYWLTENAKNFLERDFSEKVMWKAFQLIDCSRSTKITEIRKSYPEIKFIKFEGRQVMRDGGFYAK